MTEVQPEHAAAGLSARWAVLAAALFLIGSNGFIIAGVLPDIAGDLHVASTDIGFTITIYALIVAILAPVIAVVIPRMSRTTLMVLGLVAFIAGVVISALASDAFVFTVGRAIAAVGGAAVVPTATAAGAAITPPAQRGRAIAVVGIGFTLALAVGAPLGTAIAAATSWRTSMLVLAALAVIVVPVVGLVVRRVPIGQALTVTERLLVLRDPRITALLVAALLSTAAFNLVYIFSSAVTGYTGTALAALLLIYGIAGIIGTAVSGPLTDRFGSRVTGVTALSLEALALVAIALVGHAFAGLVVAFALWGATAFAAITPLQHRLLHVDVHRGAVAISWYSTALYLGIAIAPLGGAAALGAGSPALLPVIAVALSALCVILLITAHRVRAADRAGAEQATRQGR